MSHTGHFELSNFNLNFTILLENSKLWALTEGQHRPKAGKKKKTREAGLFFWFPLRSGDASSRSGLTDFSPTVISIYRPSFHS